MLIQTPGVGRPPRITSARPYEQLPSIIVKLSKAKSSKAKFPGKPGIIFAAKHVLAPHWETGYFIGVPETTPAPTLRADATRPRTGQGCALGAEDARTAVTGVDGGLITSARRVATHGRTV